MDEFANMEVIPVPAKIIREIGRATAEGKRGYLAHRKIRRGWSQVYLYHELLIFYIRRSTANSRRRRVRNISTRFSRRSKAMMSALKKTEDDFSPRSVRWIHFGNLYELLNKKVVPFLLYQVQDELEYKASFERFRDFMASYSPASDIDAVDAAIRAPVPMKMIKIARARVELLCKDERRIS